MNRIELLERNCLINRDKFINDANIKHDNLYDYTQVQYKNAQTKVTIICAVHGTFNQSPNAHLNCTIACKSCAYEQRKLTVQKNKVGPFIEKLEMVKNPKYDYSQVAYVNSRTPISIICPHHGLFEQLPSVHLLGHGCPQCGFDKTKILTYTKQVFRENPQLTDHNGILYYLRFTCRETHEIFYKIGITKYTLKKRFSKWYHTKYNIEVIDIYNTTIYNAFVVEQAIKTKHKQHQYRVTDRKFMGRTECFDCDILNGLKLEEISNGL